MKQETVKHIADGATLSAVGSGASSYFEWFTFINANAPGIGILLSFFFGVIGLVFYWLTWKKSTLADSNKKEFDKHVIAFNEHKKETRTEFQSVNSGIDSILSKLNKLG